MKRTCGLTVVLSVAMTLGAAEWQGINPIPTLVDLEGVVALDDGRQVTVGEDGIILERLTDGPWSVVTSGTEAHLYAVAAFAERVIAVGEGGALLVSDAPGLWELIPPFTEADLLEVASGPDGLAVAGAGGTIAVSTDGSNWTVATPVATDLRAAVWFQDRWVVAGDAGVVASSNDGASWNTIVIDGEPELVGLATGAGLLVALDAGDSSWASSDGTNWVQRDLGIWDRQRAIVHCDGRFIVAARYLGIATTRDGVDWDLEYPEEPSSHDFDFRDLECLGDRLLGVAAGGHVAESDSLFRWWDHTGFGGSSIVSVAAGPEAVVAASGGWYGVSTKLLISPDGVAWAEADVSVDGSWKAVAAGGGGFVAGRWGYDYDWSWVELWASPDGVEWRLTHSDLGSVQTIIWDGARWLALLHRSLGSSPNGVDWSFTEVDGNAASGRSMASDGQRIVTVGYGGRTAWSDDSLTWNDSETPTEDMLRSVAWRDGRYVAVGDAGTILTSDDGVQWRAESSAVEVTLWSVRATSAGFVAVGDDGFLLESADGVTWTAEIVPPGHQLLDVTESNGGLLVVGRDGLIARLVEDDPNAPPVASFTWRPEQPRPGEAVRFESRSSGDADSLDWSFGDGGVGEGQVVEHIFFTPEIFPVELVASGPVGAGQALASVKVAEPCMAPEAAILAPPEIDPESGAVTVHWDHPGASQYRLEVSSQPSFDLSDADEKRIVTEETHATFELDWTRSRVFYLRVLAERQCQQSGMIGANWSNTRIVELEPRADTGSALRLSIPAAAHASGLLDTEWTTDLVLHNPGLRAATAAVELRGKDAGSMSLTLGAGATRLVTDVVGELTTGRAVGSLLIGSDQPVVAVSRTSTGGAGGSYGQLIPALGETRFSVDPTRLLGLVRNESFRTNLGFASLSSVAIEVETEFLAADGLGPVGERRDALPPEGFFQITDVLDGVATGGGETEGIQGVVRVNPPGEPLIAYASVVDNRTGDPTLRSAAEPPGGWRAAVDAGLTGPLKWRDMAPCGNGAVIVSEGQRAVSHDLRNWQLSEFDESSLNVLGIAGNGEGLVAVGDSTAMVSDDCGDTWTAVEIPDAYGIRDVAWSGYRWVAVAAYGTVLTSDDALTWTSHAAALPDVADRVVRDHRGVVTVGGNNYDRSYFARSVYGAEWEVIEAPPGIVLREVAGGPVGYVASGESLWFSADGSEWSKVNDASARVTWAGDRFVAVRKDGADQSLDGRTWTSIVSPLFDDDAWRVESVADGTVGVMGWSGQLAWLTGGSDDELVVPAIAHLPGVGGTTWRSELILADTGGTGSACRLDLLEPEADNSVPRHATRELLPGETLVMTDALDDLFGLEGAGALRIGCVPATVAAESRTFTVSSVGTYGQRVPGLGAHEAIQPFESGALAGLRGSRDPESGFRSNLGLVSYCRSPMTVETVFRDGDGKVIAHRDDDLPPYGFGTRNRVLAEVGADDGRPVTLTVQSTTPGCAFVAWASVIDNVTDDPVFLTAEPVSTSVVNPMPTTTELANDEAVLVDQLPGAVGSAILPAGTYSLGVDGGGALGSVERPVHVLCLWRETGGGMRAEVLEPGDEADGIQGGDPLWCIVPDLGSCADNDGWITVDLRSGVDSRRLTLDAAANCVEVDQLAGARSVDNNFSWRSQCVTSGDFGRPELEPQALLVFKDWYSGSAQRGLVVRYGSGLPTFDPETTAVAVAVDWISAADNTGWIRLQVQ